MIYRIYYTATRMVAVDVEADSLDAALMQAEELTPAGNEPGIDDGEFSVNERLTRECNS